MYLTQTLGNLLGTAPHQRSTVEWR